MKELSVFYRHIQKKDETFSDTFHSLLIEFLNKWISLEKGNIGNYNKIQHNCEGSEQL